MRMVFENRFDFLARARQPDLLESLSPKNSALTAIELRNQFWRDETRIPSWVNIDSVGLDQFFTRPEVAQICYDSLIKTVRDLGDDPDDFGFIEPSAGLGAFYDLLPKANRIGIDIDSFNPEFIRCDFLSWQPKGLNNITLGNPPFGYRAWLALAFLNHAAGFSDFVGFILPMAFQSRGKSNVQDRVRGLSLVHSMPLPQDSFVNHEGKGLKVNALWQVWSKRALVSRATPKSCNHYIDLFTVDYRKERKCGHERIAEADFFLQRTFYNQPPKLVKDFSQVRYVCGYGIVIKKNKERIVSVLEKIDWRNYSNLASHNCRHISMGHIRAALTDQGLCDD